MIGLNPNGLLIAGVRLEKEKDAFAVSVNNLAKKLTCRVDLVCAVEPLNDYYLSSIYGVGSGQSELVYEIENERVKTNEALLKDYAKLFDTDIIRNVKVLVGNPESVLFEYASEEKANAIICGANLGGYKFVPSSLSVVLSLIKKSVFPIIVIPKGSVTGKSEKLSFMLTDNMTDSSKGAIVFSHRTQRAYPDCFVRHVHVVKDILDWRRELQSETLGSVPDADQALVNLKQMMQSRFGFLDELSKPDAKYTQYIGYGEVSSAIFDACEELDPDFIVFGPHQAIHSKPLAFGAMPWATILHSTRPVIIVPK